VKSNRSDSSNQFKSMDNSNDNSDWSVSSNGTISTSPTLKNLQVFLNSQNEGKGSYDDDASSFVSNILNNGKSVIDDAGSDTENDPVHKKKDRSGVVGAPETATLQQIEESVLKTTPVGSDMNLDNILKSLNRRREKSMDEPNFDKWENKVQKLATLLDDEKNKASKLSEIENVLTERRKKVKTDIKLAQWEAKASELEELLEKKRKERDSKLRKLVVALEGLKQEKKEMKKLTKSRPSKSRVR